MTKEQVIWTIKQNRHKKNYAIKLLSDFLVISKKKAEEIYKEEFEKV